MEHPTLQDEQPGLELAMQELEALEAPGLWTAIGASLGATLVSTAAYSGYAASIAITT